MKSVLLQGYFNSNFGDDLIISSFIKRLNQENIDVTALDNLDYLKNENIVIKFPVVLSFINKAENKLMNITPSSIRKVIKKHNTNMLKSYMNHNIRLILQVGGSLFQENDALAQQNSNKNPADLNENTLKQMFTIPRIVVGCNFGPYKTKFFYEFYKKYFENCKGVFFREFSSYDSFSMVDSCKLGTDTAFLYDEAPTSSVDKKIVISVMDFEKRFGKEISSNYIRCITDTIRKYTSLNYSVTLVSFCKSEGDENAIKNILDQIPDTEVKTLFYKNDLQEIINEFNSAEFVFATRFHSMILSWILKKPVYVFSYSNKTLNFITDNNFHQDLVCNITKNNFPDADEIFSNLEKFNELVDINSIYTKNKNAAENMMNEIIDLCNAQQGVSL